MKPKNFLLLSLLGLILLSCDSSLFIKVGLVKDLKINQKYSLIDYDFILANTNNTDKLYFEFVLNKKLDPSTIVTFLDQSGKVIVTRQAGMPIDFSSDSDDGNAKRSFVYSLMLENLRSISLVHEIIIGGQ